jgi:hypothetical protein
MNQVPVKWVYETFDEKPPAIPANSSYVVSAPLDHDILPHAVIPLSALREVVEGLKMIADGTHNQLSEWLIVRRENVIDVGEANKSSAKSLVAQRLLAHLDAEGVQ